MINSEIDLDDEAFLDIQIDQEEMEEAEGVNQTSLQQIKNLMSEYVKIGKNLVSCIRNYKGVQKSNIDYSQMVG